MKKNKKLGSLLLFAMLVVVMVGAWYNMGNDGSFDNAWNNFFGYASDNPPDATDEEPVDIDGDKVPDVMLSFSTFQALHVTFTSGDAWKYPQSRTKLVSITDLDTYKSVVNVQTNLYCTVNSDLKVDKVHYTANAYITVYKEDKKTVFKSLGSMPVSKDVTGISNDVDKYIISASMSANDFQGLIIPSGVTVSEVLYYNVKLSNIQAKLYFQNGETVTMGLTGIQATTNQLWWKFRLSQTGTVMTINSLGSVEWVWQ